MARIRHTDLAAFSNAIGLLYEAADLASLPVRVTACLHALFPCEVASFDLFDTSVLRWSTLIVSPVVPRWDEAVSTLQRHVHEHAIVSHALANDYPHAIRTSDLVSLRRYRQTGIYRELFSEYVEGCDRQLGYLAKPSPTLTLGSSVNRKGRDFSAEERALMELLRPHLLRAYTLASVANQAMRTRAEERERSASLAGGEMCQTDAEGKVGWMTPGLPRVLASFFHRETARADRLPRGLLQMLGLNALRQRAPRDALPGLPRTCEFVEGDVTLRVQVAAAPAENCWQLLFTEQRRETFGPQFSAHYGLSARESEALRWICEGKTNPEVAVILGISSRTVEKHVERVLAKLAVPNRAAAIRLALDAGRPG